MITNPPFYLFREFVAWLVGADKTFSIIGTSNALTYKDIFTLIKANRLWKGATANNTDIVFLDSALLSTSAPGRRRKSKSGSKPLISPVFH